MTGKKRSTSSIRWLKKHFNDKYVQKSKKMGLRSRAWFKLSEIQKEEKIFRSGITVVDLGASPGGWSQYITGHISSKIRVIACDILPMKPIVGVDFFQGDFREESVRRVFFKSIGKDTIQVVMSDMAPNISGIPAVDIPRSMHLAGLALETCRDILVPGGSFVVKLFQGEGFNDCLLEIRSLFTKVKIHKLNSSRSRSREVYIVATGRKI